MEEFEKLVAESFQSELIPAETAAAEDVEPVESSETQATEPSSESLSETSNESLSECSESLSETKKAG
jgi:hypothetical protein